ncbi:hypothetical protein [Engelhardtia mirabilis]|uniref:Prolyl 4-hydroxylase alpha subunit domain-containing protein n=1 Tax=Engelhardtia mirabilis TaxID=2528011 RepID=A0A518BKU6_9BACT|nr:hypothetical protein Pla133_26800 [Planctomycetes bacterium Pla133]QDV01918.1 hypothetical protein Pla86_26790 [Planctomycetes bacterium Pla86]
MSELPSDWQAQVRRACAGARATEFSRGLLRVELDLGGVTSAMLSRHDELGAAGGEPNSMHESGASLEQLGLGELGAILRSDLAEPLRRAFLADVASAPLTSEYAYIVDYGERGDRDLALHVDESCVTINLCLGDWFEGGELRLAGLRCGRHRQSEPREDELFAVDHEPGLAWIHLGAHRHLVPPLDQGRRRNLIVWCSAADGPLSASMECRPFCGDWLPDAG